MTAGWLLLFIIPALGQVEKPIGTWNVNLVKKYPNPMMEAGKCKTSKPSGLCDPNEMLDSAARNNINDKLEAMENTTYGDRRIRMRVAVMRVFGPQIANTRAEAEMFPPAFRVLWNLDNFTVVVIASVNDSVSYIEAGSDVEEFLGKNFTDSVDTLVYEEYFKKGLYVKGIQMAVERYNSTAMDAALALELSAQTSVAQTTETSDQAETTTFPTWAIILIVVLSLLTLIIIIVMVLRKRSRRSEITKEEESLNRQV